MNINKLFITALLFLFIAAVQAESAQLESYVGSEQFERMKTLAGTWRGTSSMGKEGELVTVKYEIKSAGSAIVETLFPDAAHEMVSVYHDNSGKLSMTHYCALKNQPTMALQHATKDKIDFVYAGGTNIDPSTDAHMHALGIEFTDDDHIVQQWVLFEAGKQAGVNTLTLSRVSE